MKLFVQPVQRNKMDLFAAVAFKFKPPVGKLE